jgi:peptidoglycan-N-acetylglucosamine deacetylase
MLYAGVAWHAKGYEVSFCGDGDRAEVPSATFGAAARDKLIAYLRQVANQSGRSLVTVVESSNGILDGSLMGNGLDVYRADPWVLPGRPAFGSVGAAALAEAAQRDLSALTRLCPDGGTLTGRIEEMMAAITSSEPAEEPLREAGRWFEHGGRDEPVVALTFDDGPNPPYTGRILDVLEDYGVPATFFCVGLNAVGLPAEIARIRSSGHAIANHTWSHAYLPDLSQDQLHEQIGRTSEVLAPRGASPAMLFRPPYGSRTPQIVDWLGRQETTVVLWDVDSGDWTMPGADAIADAVLKEVRPGSIILMHDGGGDRGQTAAALPTIIEGVHERGLRFVRLEEMDVLP